MKYYKIMNPNGVIGIFSGDNADTEALKGFYESVNLKVQEISKEAYDEVDEQLNQ